MIFAIDSGDYHRQYFKMFDEFKSLIFQQTNGIFFWLPHPIFPSKPRLTQEKRKCKRAKIKVMTNVTTVATSTELQSYSLLLPCNFFLFSNREQSIRILSNFSSVLFQQSTALVTSHFFVNSRALKLCRHKHETQNAKSKCDHLFSRCLSGSDRWSNCKTIGL
jgi:hypothetical protein